MVPAWFVPLRYDTEGPVHLVLDGVAGRIGHSNRGDVGIEDRDSDRRHHHHTTGFASETIHSRLLPTSPNEACHPGARIEGLDNFHTCNKETTRITIQANPDFVPARAEEPNTGED